MKSINDFAEKIHEGIGSAIAKNIIKLLLRPTFRKEYDKLEKQLNDPDFKTSLMRYHNRMDDIEKRLERICKTNPNEQICSERFKKLILKR